MRARPGRGADREPSRCSSPGPVLRELGEELLLGGEQPLGVPVEREPGLGRLDPPPGAVEELAARAAPRAPRTWRLTAGCVTPSRSAACEKLRRSTTAQNACSCRVSISRSYGQPPRSVRLLPAEVAAQVLLEAAVRLRVDLLEPAARLGAHRLVGGDVPRGRKRTRVRLEAEEIGHLADDSDRVGEEVLAADEQQPLAAVQRPPSAGAGRGTCRARRRRCRREPDGRRPGRRAAAPRRRRCAPARPRARPRTRASRRRSGSRAGGASGRGRRGRGGSRRSARPGSTRARRAAAAGWSR